MRAILLSYVLLTACTTGDEYTWREASLVFSGLFCTQVAACGFGQDIDLCTEHISWHMCEPAGNCDVDLDWATAEDALRQCADALVSLDDYGCYLLGWHGQTPRGCDAFWELQPQGMP